MNEQNNKNKVTLKDRIISKVVGEAPEEILTNAGLALGTLYGMKKKNMNFSKAVATTGLAGGAAGMIVGSSASNTLRLRNQHKKEFGTNPSKKDYAAIFAVNAIPSAIGYGVFAKNKGEVEEAVQKVFDFRKGVKNNGVLNVAKSGVKNFAQKVNPNNLKNIKLSDLKNIKVNPKTLRRAAGLAALTAVVEGPSFLVTPETIINKKREKMNNVNKTASEMIDELFKMEVTASEMIDELFEKEVLE